MGFSLFKTKEKKSGENQTSKKMKNARTIVSKEKNTIKIGKNTWAINLKWIPKDNNIKNEAEVKRFIKDTAKSQKADFALNNKGLTIGFTSKSKGHKKKMPSLASAVAESYPGSFIAVIRTDLGYYIVSSKSGTVDPGSDILVPLTTTSGEIFEILKKAADRFDQDIELKVFIAKELEISETEEWTKPLEKMKPKFRLQDVDPSAQLKLFVTRGILFSIFAGVMYYAYNLYEQMTAPPPPPKEVTLPAKPWANKEYPDQAILNCITAIQKGLKTGPGWTPQATVCKEGEVSTAFKRENPIEAGGIPYSWMFEFIDSNGYPKKGASVADNGIVTYSMSVPEAKDVWFENTNPKDNKEVVREIRDKLDKIFKSAKVSEKKERYYITNIITVETDKNPEQVAEVVKGIDGVILDKITYDNGTGKYSIAVAIVNEQNTPKAERVKYTKPKPVRKFDTDYAEVYAR